MTAQFNRILQANGADDLLRQGLDATIGEEVGAAMADERAAMMTADVLSMSSTASSFDER